MPSTLNQLVARTVAEDRLRAARRRAQAGSPDRSPPRMRRGAAVAVARLARRLDAEAAQRVTAA